MDAQPCPACEAPATREPLAKMSRLDSGRYHRCHACGHVWVTFDDGRPLHHVTPLPARGAGT